MTDLLEFTVDKFTFAVPTDRLYHPDGLWVHERDGRLRVGLTDYFQGRAGDVAFVELVEAGAALARGERLGGVETVKSEAELAAPVSGTVAAVNDRLELAAELINQDPYGEGWLVVIEPVDWPAEQSALLSAEAYYELSQTQALEEIGRS